MHNIYIIYILWILNFYAKRTGLSESSLFYHVTIVCYFYFSHFCIWKSCFYFPAGLNLLFSHSVMSNSLQPCVLQHTRLPCPSPSPRVCSNPCPLSQWCHPTIPSFVVPFSSCLQSFPVFGSFKWVSSSHQVAKVLALQHQTLHWISGLVSFRIDWFDLLAVQGTLKSLL